MIFLKLLMFLFFPVFLFAQSNIIRIEGNAQGTTYHITYFDSLNRNFEDEITQILIDFDSSLSTYITNSIISRINANEENVELDSMFLRCFIKAKEVWKNTNGAFDPTVFPLVNAWGFGPTKKMVIRPEVIDSILNFVGFEKIELLENKIIKKDPRVALDFNAFAQGYSVDVVADFLFKKKVSSFLVEIGGELFAKGKKPNGENWKIGIEKPIDNKESSNPLNSIAKLENIALATSGNYRRFIIENGIKYAHHIDPKTGYPTKNNLLSASVFAPDCISADANATGILVLGLKKAKKFVKKHKELKVYLIYSDKNGNYKIYKSPELNDIISEE